MSAKSSNFRSRLEKKFAPTQTEFAPTLQFAPTQDLAPTPLRRRLRLPVGANWSVGVSWRLRKF
jgi:hypothetical protein